MTDTDKAQKIARSTLDRFRQVAEEGGDYILSSMEREIRVTVEPMAIVAALRLRTLVESDPLPAGIERRPADGAHIFRVGDANLSLAEGLTRNGHPVTNLSVVDDGGDRILGADFHVVEGKSIVGATCAPGQESGLFAFLDRIRPLVPTMPGALARETLPITARYGDEIELVEADGGLPGAICREVVLGMYRMMAQSVLIDAAAALPTVTRIQAENGYVWGEKFLTYEDFDRRACSVPVDGHVAAFYVDIDVCSHLNAFLVAAKVDPEGLATEVMVWGVSRDSDDAYVFVESARTGGVGSLRQPNLRLDLRTGALTMKEASDPDTLIGTVLYGIRGMSRAFVNLPATLEQGGTEERTDFEIFSRSWDPDGDGPAP